MEAFGIATPEIFLLGAMCTVLLLNIFLTKESPLMTYLAAQLSLWTTILLVIVNTRSQPEKIIGLNGFYVIDELGAVLKISILLVTSMAFVYARKYLREQGIWQGEFFVLGMGAVLGMLIMVSGYNLLVLYLGLEMMALSLYAMVAFQRDSSRATEAAMKYFVLGAIASGLLLYGISMFYGMSNTLEVDKIRDFLSTMANQSMLNNNLLFLFSLTFVLAGIAFKLGIVPFHMWMPDVYQGAPTAVSLFLGTAPKIAGLALMLRLLAEGFNPGLVSWAQIMLVLGILSVIVGNFIAIAQTSLKRMFAYSSIAHMGFVLLAVVTGGADGYSAALFYSIVYALMVAGGFATLILLGREAFEADELDSLKGLNARSPWYAFLMLLILFSMAGIPPMVGFYAKLAVIKAVISAGYLIPAIIMVVMSVVGAYYYLRAIKFMYFDKPEDTTPLEAEFDFQVLYSINGLAMLILGLFPGVLMAICAAAVVAGKL